MLWASMASSIASLSCSARITIYATAAAAAAAGCGCVLDIGGWDALCNIGRWLELTEVKLHKPMQTALTGLPPMPVFARASS